MTPWQVLQIFNSGSPVRSASANVRAFSMSPSRWFFSCSTPDPVHDALRIASNSSSMPSLPHTSIVAEKSSGAAPRETQPG